MKFPAASEPSFWDFTGCQDIKIFVENFFTWEKNLMAFFFEGLTFENTGKLDISNKMLSSFVLLKMTGRFGFTQN
jgi:CTP:phosphocholine cytidylyltransferase-like protein